MKLHYEIDGPSDAATVVLGGSLGSTLDIWTPQLDALTPGFRLVRYDHRGHGGTPSVPGPYTIAELGRDVVELLDDLAIERAHVGGLSLGGMVAMWLAAHAADRVDRVALLCTSALLGPASAWHERAALVRSRGTSAVASTVVGRWFTGGFANDYPADIAELVAMVGATDPEGYASCCEAIADMDLRADLAGVAAPTLVIAGADDPATPPEHAYEIASRIAGARVEVVRPAAHLASWERASEVNRLLLGHFASSEG